ncbi:hypothetical protein Tco_0890396 [Tanacetum coccineum]|uniref:Uncharacterized protein n=1 Tax=Tanacetum coccineum TaxID=301880 RepID=A0ABQ5C5E0_9ASTR
MKGFVEGDREKLDAHNTTSLGESTQPGVSTVNPSGVSSYVGRARNLSLEDKALLTGGDCESAIDRSFGILTIPTFPWVSSLNQGNGNVQLWDLLNANQDPLGSNVKAMMTLEYCPATELQRMEQELGLMTIERR